MKDAFSRLKDRIMGQINEDSDNLPEEQYLEINPSEVIDSKAKIMVRPFIIKEFQDIKPALDGLREGHTIALVNIKPLKDKDIVELKRAVNKLKKTCDAIEGDIAGFGEDWLVATPSFAKVHRQTSVSTQRTSGIIENEDDMKVRVIKSSEATVKIPQMRMSMEPGTASTGFLSNIEGLLNRFKKIIESERDNAEDQSIRKKAKNLLKKLWKVELGEEKLKIIIEDPSGNSAIVSDRAETKKL